MSFSVAYFDMHSGVLYDNISNTANVL